MSVLLVAGRRRERAQRVVDAVAAQDRGELEIVVADLDGETAEPLRLPERTPARVVSLPAGTGWGAARAAALRESSAGVVAFVEDHCVPAPGWAAALLEAHRGPWAAVGYAFTNANPGTYLASAAFHFDYGLWAHPARGGESPLLAYNNVSYKRRALEGLPGPLETFLETDFHVHRELLRRGERLGVERLAVAAHENYERLAPLLAANHHYCRVLAAGRARLGGWGLPRRLLYGLATPAGGVLVSLARRARCLRGRPALVGPTLAALPVVVLAASWAAAGEALGYFFGAGGSALELVRWEVHEPRAEP